MISLVKIWYQNIFEYFQFVHLRRTDQRFGILPGITISLVFLTLSVAMTGALFLFTDHIVLEWIRQPDRQYPEIFRTITLLGSVNWILFITGAILVLLSLRNARRFKGQKNLIWHRLFLNAYFAFTGIVFTGLLGNLFKNLIGRARPQFTPEPDIWVSIPFEHYYQFASFPSGHATTGGAIAVTLALLFPRWWLFFITGGILVAVSRPVLGVHFPSDVLAGFLFGGSFIWIYARIFARKRLLFAFDDHGKLVLRGESSSRKLPVNVCGTEMN